MCHSVLIKSFIYILLTVPQIDITFCSPSCEFDLTHMAAETAQECGNNKYLFKKKKKDCNGFHMHNFTHTFEMERHFG